VPRTEKYLHTDSASCEFHFNNRALIIFLSGSRTSYSVSPPSRRIWAVAENELIVGGIKPSVIYKRQRAHSTFLLVAFHRFYLKGDANELANNEFSEYRLFLNRLFFLLFVLCVTNIDLYGDLFQNFDLNILWTIFMLSPLCYFDVKN